MQKLDFNRDWTFRKEGSEEAVTVTLPHDAQLHEKRSADASDSGHAYFPGGSYTYRKTFAAPVEWKNQIVTVNFEGVYQKCTVSLNGEAVCAHKYGYSAFDVELTGLRYGADNEITVAVTNEVPNSRWYAGAGIYRPVWLTVADPVHLSDIRIDTLSIDTLKIRVRAEAAEGNISVRVMDGEMVLGTGEGRDCGIELAGAKLWSAKSPKLYTCELTLTEDGEVRDMQKIPFGIRRITWGPEGLFVNGKETLLRGGCIHADNGVLGAAEYDEAAARRVKIMKDNGFNAIRMAHNPCSEALLRACDRIGMYIMDEFSDMWYNSKTGNDFGRDFMDCWETDLPLMVKKDYNHPSVILYSIGNEVGEPAEKKGQELARAMVDKIHEYDVSRPTTAGLNLMIITRAAKGNALYKDGEQTVGSPDKKDRKEKKDNQNASLLFNTLVSFIGTGMNKSANSDKADRICSPVIDTLDIAGYNYASGRYPLEGKKHPNRVIVGSETFPQELAKNWKMVQKYPYLVGDFMWTGWDYLGEAGIGAWSYGGGMPFNRPYPWKIGGSGQIDISGNPDGSCFYTSVIWGRRRCAMAVRPANHPGERVSKSMWRGTNAIPSWSWSGCEGNKTIVEVYAKGVTAKLFLNGKLIGTRRIHDRQAQFKVKYAPGTLEAVCFDKAGNEISRCELTSAVGEHHIALRPEKKLVKSDAIVYVPITIEGENGVVESADDRKITVTVEGGELLGFGSANPCTEESFVTGGYTTYYGRALAVVRAGEHTVVRATDGVETAEAVIEL